LLAGGGASRELQDVIAREGMPGVTKRLGWLGAPSALRTSHVITWEDDAWAGGGYAVFGPGFDSRLREWLARPCGRVFFAGEHTHARWQGYMNGAIESGQRAAAEVVTLAGAARRAV
jgi:monoamine oxidase